MPMETTSTMPGATHNLAFRPDPRQRRLESCHGAHLNNTPSRNPKGAHVSGARGTIRIAWMYKMPDQSSP
ncbi:hypothetical protein L249_1129 [Ophiocordyceps polyrhachis-furcata BCC 54312]|uniref:Uncharacterized protein n=1 Tax=Ophiocordyceps polyrhachis-furcata BCC 54312 TaxID=1330021 RepID=A0A367LD98_9HYPO|nr:hypothetical protein L249_1129 [Ophiocordyceps polyrhachis-furcata BCC 54312]